MHRTLGFRLTTQGQHLMSFVRFSEEHSTGHVTADLAIEWATRTSRGSGDEVYQARRLDVVRIFARHLQALDPATEVPPRGRAVTPLPADPVLSLLPKGGRRAHGRDRCAPALRAATWRTLIGLLAVTGMRQGEACRLERNDVDLQAGTLLIADSKFGPAGVPAPDRGRRAARL